MSVLGSLRAAAEEIVLEESIEGRRGLLLAADSYAADLGVASPIKNGVVTDSRIRNWSATEDTNALLDSMRISEPIEPPTPIITLPSEERQQYIPRDHLPKDEAKHDIQADVRALLSLRDDVAPPKLNVDLDSDGPASNPPRRLSEAKLAETCPAVLNLHPTTPKKKRQEPNRALSQSAAWEKQKYLDRLATMRTKDILNNSLRSSRQNLDTIAIPSELSRRINDADSKSYGERIRSTFRTEQEERLMRSMYKIANAEAKEHPKSAPRIRDLRKSIDRLSQPGRKGYSEEDLLHDPTLRWSTFEDAKEATFRPVTTRKKQAKDDITTDDRYGFIQRMEAGERHRRDRISYEQEKVKYDARVDKKQCPSCGSKQSYDEYREKRKLCVACRKPYCYRITWGAVQRHFLKKCTEHAHRVKINHEKLQSLLEEEFRFYTTKIYDPKTKQIVEVTKERNYTISPDELEEFFHRLEQKELEKEENLRRLDHEVYAEKYPFKPIISRTKKVTEDDDELDDGDDEGHNPVTEFLNRYEDDIRQRRENFPQKYISSPPSVSYEGSATHDRPFRV